MNASIYQMIKLSSIDWWYWRDYWLLTQPCLLIRWYWRDYWLPTQPRRSLQSEQHVRGWEGIKELLSMCLSRIIEQVLQ